MSFLPSFSKSQKRGILLLIGILVLVGGWRLRVWYLAQNPVSPGMVSPSGDSTEVVSGKVEINSADSATFETLPGIGPVLSGRIVKYRRIRGGFTDPRQLGEVFGLKPETLEGILPRLWADTTGAAFQALQAGKSKPGGRGDWALERERDRDDAFQDKREYPPHTPPVGAQENPNRPPPRPLMLDLNKADSATLTQAPGIGEKTAGRIVRFRKSLGFFHSVAQLGEVWGILPENYEKMKGSFFVEKDLAPYPHLLINSASYETLDAHPYLDKSAVKIILAYRKEHGPLKTIEDCRKMYGIGPEVWDKVGPYLQF